MTGRRLEPQQRREQLLDIGAAMFAEKPYEDVFIEDIAGRAGVSRALLYHYFPSKRDLYVAIFKRASNRLLARANPDPQLPLAAQLADGLEAHIQYFADHPFEAVAINRGALSDDPAIHAIITEELNVVGQRLIDKLVAEGRRRDFTEIAVEGWLAFVRAACVKWVQSQKITRAELTEMCLRGFKCALGCPGTPREQPKELVNNRLRRGVFGSLAGLTTAITTGAAHRDGRANAFVWRTAKAAVVTNVQRSLDALRHLDTQTDPNFRITSLLVCPLVSLAQDSLFGELPWTSNSATISRPSDPPWPNFPAISMTKT
jgi:AcrR family transcriptional regulator